MQEETNPVLSSWNHRLYHQSQFCHQSHETPAWTFLATLRPDQFNFSKHGFFFLNFQGRSVGKKAKKKNLVLQ